MKELYKDYIKLISYFYKCCFLRQLLYHQSIFFLNYSLFFFSKSLIYYLILTPSSIHIFLKPHIISNYFSVSPTVSQSLIHYHQHPLFLSLIHYHHPLPLSTSFIIIVHSLCLLYTAPVSQFHIQYHYPLINCLSCPFCICTHANHTCANKHIHTHTKNMRTLKFPCLSSITC